MLRRTAVIFALAGSVLFACGCQGKPAQDDVSIEKSLHETIRQHGRSFDCWVEITKTTTEQGGFTGRTTVWGCEESPTGWVRRIRETRDPRNNAMARLQEQVVDYRVR